MQGIITLKTGKQYLFRNDHGHGNAIWAWNIYDKIVHDRVLTHKWKKLRKRGIDYFVFFDLENPPQTVSWLPLLEGS